MNAPRFHCPLPLAAGSSIELPPGAARHAARVLRLAAGDELVLFNGAGGEYVSSIKSVERERVSVNVLEWRGVEREAPLAISLVQALSASEKMDFAVQKAVELGAAKIVPVASKRSVLRLSGERAARRVEHWRGVVVAACEQCGRNRLPEVAALEDLDKWLARPAPAGALRLLFDPLCRRTLGELAPPAPGVSIELLIGAEGGLAPDEIELALRAGFTAVRLGPRVLRTETAGVAALAALQCLWGDFKAGF
jgi:16S rRNA (uracil1498-N3)-methyltransferase